MLDTNGTVGTTAVASKAREHVEKAGQHLKPRMTWWRPRYRKAADEYCKAAKCHHQVGAVDDALSDLLKALECYEKKRNWYPAAKTLEQVILLSLRKDLTDESVKALKERTFYAASLYRKSGHPDGAASVLERVSKALEAKDMEGTILLLEKAAETVETENRPFQASCYTSRLLAMALELNDLRTAVKRVRKLVSLYQVCRSRTCLMSE